MSNNQQITKDDIEITIKLNTIRYDSDQNKYGVVGSVNGFRAGGGGALNYKVDSPLEWRESKAEAIEVFIERTKKFIVNELGYR